MKVQFAVALSIACAGLVSSERPAHAQDSSLVRAEGHFNKAQALFINAKYEEAAIEFQAAYQARPLPPFLFNIGACYEKLAKSDPSTIKWWDNAIKNYRKFLKEQPKARDRNSIRKRITILRAERDRIKANLQKAGVVNPDQVKTSAEVEALQDAVIRGLVVIESEPSEALIYIDDKKKGPISKTPWTGTIEGEHTIFIERRGYKPVEKRISPSPDKLLVLSFTLAEEDYLGWIDIRSNVPGADIYIDDKAVGVYSKTPFSGNLKPGKHKIWITADGYDEYYEEIEIAQGRTHTVNAKLKGSPVGYLNVRGEGIENSAVYLDGKILCARGPCRKAVTEGAHRVEIRRSGYKSFSRTLEVQPKTEVIMKVRLAKKPGRGDAIWAYVFTAAFAGGGIFLGLQGQSLHDDLKAEIDTGSPPPDRNDSRFQRGKLFLIGADAAYALAGITLLTAVYYTFRDKGPPSRGTIDVRAVALEPHLAPGYAGLGMEVKW
ncbi:MAG: PEGA domain-containing protein [Proteobacteria bacterium]|nr:PEGA domain-containing protein [Pseudomonadota bacterium]